MAKIKTAEQELELPDGSPIKETCRELGVPFGCESGLCATCEVEVIEGYDNLGLLNEREQEMGLEGNHRLCCQCVISSGEITIKF